MYKKHGITHVLNCSKDIPQIEGYELQGFKRVAVSDTTSEEIFEHFREANKFIDETMSDENNKLFIHCREGKSRSATILTAYLMWKENLRQFFFTCEFSIPRFLFLNCDFSFL